MITEIKVESDVLKLILTLEKIYDTCFKLVYNPAPDKLSGRWEVVYCETDTVFACAANLDFLKAILGIYIESETKFVPQ